MDWRAILANPAVLTGLIRAILILLVTFGVGVSQPQQDSVLEAVGALLAVISLVMTGVTTTLTTSRDKPTLDEGTNVEVITPTGEPNRNVTL